MQNKQKQSKRAFELDVSLFKFLFSRPTRSQMPDHRKTPQQIKKMDAQDRISHPMHISDGTIAYHFTLGGNSGQCKALQYLLSDKPSRYQIPLCCPICKSSVGMYIYSAEGMEALSENQQRKNRNTMLFGKSHMKRTHPVLKREPVPPEKLFEPNVTQAAEVVAKRFRAGPAASSTRPTQELPPSISPVTGVKRKPQPMMSTKQVMKRSKTVSEAPIHLALPVVRQHMPVTPAAAATLPPLSTCERKPNHYYVDAEGQTHYDKPRGWHPDDEDLSDGDSSE